MSNILTCSMYKNVCYLRIDLYNVFATIEVHSPEEVPVYDSSDLHHFNSSEHLSITYKIIETL